MDRDITLRDVGYRLRIALETTGLPFAEIARTCGVTPNRMHNWLRGAHPVDIFFLIKLDGLYRINPDYILVGKGVEFSRLLVHGPAAPAVAASAE